MRARLVQKRLLNLLGFLQDSLSHQGYTLEQLDRLGDFKLRKSSDRGCECSYVRVLPFRPTVETIDDLRSDLLQLIEPPSRAFLYYQENDANDRRLAALQWLLAPIRDGETPFAYRLLPYNGGPLAIEELP